MYPNNGFEILAAEVSKYDNDHKILHEAWCNFSSDESITEFSLQKLGPLNPTRCITTYIRFLQICTGIDNLSNKVCVLCKYVLKIYVLV